MFIFLTDLLNGAEDVVSVNSNLLVMYGINMMSENRDGGVTRVITLVGEAAAESYERVSLKSQQDNFVAAAKSS